MEVIKTEERMQPVIILKNGTMATADISRLRKNGFCVVESKEPSTVRFLDPAPQGYSVQQWAAIQLARVLLRDGKIGTYNLKQSIGSMYADILMASDPLSCVEIIKETP